VGRTRRTQLPRKFYPAGGKKPAQKGRTERGKSNIAGGGGTFGSKRGTKAVDGKPGGLAKRKGVLSPSKGDGPTLKKSKPGKTQQLKREKT